MSRYRHIRARRRGLTSSCLWAVLTLTVIGITPCEAQFPMPGWSPASWRITYAAAGTDTIVRPGQPRGTAGRMD